MLEDRIVLAGLVLDVHADDIARLHIGELGGIDHQRGAPAVKHGFRIEDDGSREGFDERHRSDGEADALETQAGGLQLFDGGGGDGGLEIAIAVRPLELRPVAPVVHVLEDRIVLIGLVLDVHTDDITLFDIGKLGGIDHDRGAPAVECGHRIPKDGALGLDGSVVTTAGVVAAARVVTATRVVAATGVVATAGVVAAAGVVATAATAATASGSEVFREVEFQRSEAVAGEQDVPFDEGGDEGRVVGEVDRHGPGAVAVVDDPLVAGLDVAHVPVRIPPAGGHANLRIGGLDVQVERAGRHPIPHILRKFGDALVVAVMAFQSEAVLAGPAHRLAEFVLPEDFERGSGIVAFDPDFLLEVQFDRGEAVAGEQEMALDEGGDEGRILGEVDLHGPGAVAVVGDQLVAGLDVAHVPARIPPAGGHAHLRIGGRDVQIEGLGHHLVPDVLRDLGDAFVVAVVTLQGEAVLAAPADGGAVLVLPNGSLDDFRVAAAFDPDVLQEVERNRGEAVAGEQEMALDEGGDEGRVLGEVDRHGPGAVAVVDDPLVAGLDVAHVPVRIPPAGGHAHLRISGRDVQVEGLGHHLVPDVLRNLGDALVVAVVAFQGEAVLAAPADGRAVAVLPDDGLHGLPVAAVGGGYVVQFRKRNLLAIKGVEFADPGALEDLLGDGDNDGVRALAVEVLVLEDERIAVGIDQFDAGDELQVGTVDGQLLATTDLLAVHLGKARDDGVADGEFLSGFRLLVRSADDDLAGGDAGRRGHADHSVADMLDVGDGDTAREHDLADIAEAGAVDGHRRSGDDLRREERLDAQGARIRVDDFLGGTCRQRAQKDNGKQQADMFEYILHN